MLRIILLLCLLGEFVATGVCQGTGSSGAAKQLVRARVSMMLIAGAKPAAEAFIEGPGKSRVSISLSAAAKSGPYLYEGSNPLVIYVADTTVPAGRRAVASVVLPASAPQLFILLAPSGKAGPTEPVYLGVAVEDDLSKVPAGSIRFLNYSGKQVFIKAAGEAFSLAKGPSKSLSVIKAGQQEVEVPIEIAEGEAGALEPAYGNSIKCKANERLTLILLPSTKPSGRGVSVVLSRDVVPSGGAKAPPVKK